MTVETLSNHHIDTRKLAEQAVPQVVELGTEAERETTAETLKRGIDELAANYRERSFFIDWRSMPWQDGTQREIQLFATRLYDESKIEEIFEIEQSFSSNNKRWFGEKSYRVLIHTDDQEQRVEIQGDVASVKQDGRSLDDRQEVAAVLAELEHRVLIAQEALTVRPPEERRQGDSDAKTKLAERYPTIAALQIGSLTE